MLKVNDMSIDVTRQVSLNIAALESEFNAITNNLANVSTAGYKRFVSSFAETLARQQSLLGDNDISSANLQVGIDFSQGLSMIETGRSLDVALQGKGFFVIETAEGPLYTRNGMFRANQNGQITDSLGRIVSGQAGPVTIPADIALSQVNIAADGSVKAGDTTLGQLRVVSFGDNENKLIPAGDNCFRAPNDLAVLAEENAAIRQGYLESSNVKMIDELVDMIMVSRLYQANMKFITARKDAGESLMSLAMG
ncbi:MAG: flagellar hook basal-body protein [Phycisphaerae bacterium]